VHQDPHIGEPDPLPARDASAALATTGGDAELAAQLFATLREGLPNEIDRLRHHTRAQAWADLADAAHRVRGATAYCGVPALDRALQELERVARNSDLERIPASLEHVERETERLIAYRGE
jgi:two-component system sensor histidine kinase BarA